MNDVLRCGRFTFDLARPRIMGIVNVTADSFSDGGKYLDMHAAIDHARRLCDEGADLVDIGGESTRPGAVPVPADEELRRVMPVIEALVRGGAGVSVDTMKPAVMRAAIAAGACMVNDVNGFRTPGAIEAVAASEAGACIMHMQGEPATMQKEPRYDDVVTEVASYLKSRARALEDAGIGHDRIAIDPGFGFGKTVAHNKLLLHGIPALVSLGYPVLAGLSRKRMIGDFTGRPPQERTAGSVVAALLAVQNGASLVRVHDVRETVDAINVWIALR